MIQQTVFFNSLLKDLKLSSFFFFFLNMIWHILLSDSHIYNAFPEGDHIAELYM